MDVGTTSVKLCLFAADGGLLSTARHATPSVLDAWGEIYDVAALVALATGFIGSLDPKQRDSIERLAITGVGESGGLVRSDLTLASPMILWHDHRGAPYLDRLGATDRARIFGITGLPINANYGVSKAVWALEQGGEAARGAKWMNIAEYLAGLMTGVRFSEYSLASRTMALDLRTRSWSAEACDIFGIDVDVLPELRSASDGVPITTEFASATGLPAGVHVHVAGHDHMVGAVGAELDESELLNSTGTTEGLLMRGISPSLDDHARNTKLANGVSCDGRDFTLFASIPTGGSAFETLQALVGQSAPDLTATISSIHGRYLAGEIDLDQTPLVLPQFRGSPPPAKDARARGIISGIRTGTDASAIVFGCFLGMVMQFRDVLDLFPVRPESIKVIGPAAKNPLWLQLKADLLATPLSVSRFPEVVSRGAQALASGDRFAWSASDPYTVQPDPERHARLHEWSEEVGPKWEYLKGMPA
jgi:sugar (pentulose or hexulose) kinase